MRKLLLIGPIIGFLMMILLIAMLIWLNQLAMDQSSFLYGNASVNNMLTFVTVTSSIASIIAGLYFLGAIGAFFFGWESVFMRVSGVFAILFGLAMLALAFIALVIVMLMKELPSGILLTAPIFLALMGVSTIVTGVGYFSHD